MANPSRVLGLALRPDRRVLPVAVETARASAGGSLEGDHGGGGRRGLTFLAEDSWRATCEALGRTLPWTTRRANVLVSGGDLRSWIGREVRAGGLRVRIEGETHPCALMEQLAPGLEAALSVEGRGGVYGRILEGGVLSTGDEVLLQEA